MSTRRIAISPEHVNALNLVEVDFYRCKKVEAAWKEYQRHLNHSNHANTPEWHQEKDKKLAQMLFEIASVLGFKIPALDIFQGGYAPQGWTHKENRANDVLEYLHKVSEGNAAFPIWIAGVNTPENKPEIPPENGH